MCDKTAYCHKGTDQKKEPKRKNKSAKTEGVKKDATEFNPPN